MRKQDRAKRAVTLDQHQMSQAIEPPGKIRAACLMIPRLGRLWKHPGALLLGILLFHTINNVIQLSLDQAPLVLNEAMYFESSGRLLAAVSRGDPQGIIHSLQGSHPPLHQIVPLPFYLILGYSPDIAILSTLPATVVLILSIYHIGKELQDRDAGLMAAALSVLAPGLFAFSRTYFQEFTLAAMVALSLALLLKTNHLSRKWYVVVFGVSTALGLLAKWTYSLFVAAPLFVYVYQSYSKTLRLPGTAMRAFYQRGRWLPFSIITGLLVASPWYLPNLGHIRASLKVSGIGIDAGLGTISNILHYPRHLYVYQLGPVFSLLALGSALYLLCVRHRSVGFLSGWFLLPYLFFTFLVVQNKTGRFVISALPALMLLIGIACVTLPRRWKHLCILLLLGAGLIQFVSVSYASGVVHLPNRNNIGGPRPNIVDFGQAELVSALNSLLENRSDPLVTVLDHQIYSSPTLMYLQLMGQLVPFRVYDTGNCTYEGYCDGKPYGFYEELFRRSDVVLTDAWLNPPPETFYGSPEHNRILQAWNATEPLFRDITSLSFPDGISFPEENQLIVHARRVS